MATPQEALDTALEHHRAGRLQLAEESYQDVLATQPQDVDALHLLGVVWHQQGKHDAAIQNIRQAIALKPESEVMYTNLGAAYQATGRLEQAVKCWREALQIKPTHMTAHQNLCEALRAHGRSLDIVSKYEEALAGKPSPDFINAFSCLARFYAAQGRLVESAQTYLNLADFLSDSDQHEDALAYYQIALELRPDFAVAHEHLGVALAALGKLDKAVASIKRAIQFNLESPRAYTNLGHLLEQLGDREEGLSNFRKALKIDPDFAEAHMCLAHSLLQKGDFEEGWIENEWRWKSSAKEFKSRDFSRPIWDGRPGEDQRILIHAEQGLGDVLQFVRYAELVKQQGCHVVVVCPRPLATILRQCPYIDQVVTEKPELPPYDAHIPLLSLPRVLGTTLSNVPARVPYLFARDDLIRKWRVKLSDLKGLKIGISWQGSPKRATSRQRRSCSLSDFASLAYMPEIHLISLQKGAASEQLAKVGFPVRTLGNDFDEGAGAFMDSAAVMMVVDLVITVDTALAHLAGGLGVPAWVVLPYSPDWRWMLDREDSPWYPRMRLFRQEESGDWYSVFDQVRAALVREISERTTLKPIRVDMSPGELFDKISILRIKTERLQDLQKLRNTNKELKCLEAVARDKIDVSAELSKLQKELKEVNETLWEIEDELRICERHQDFGRRFVELARSVYRNNDRRAAVKREINELLGSTLIEEKSYEDYE